MLELNAVQGGIFRIVHVSNLPWILDHGGLHCQNAQEQDPNYVNIGSTELISKRARTHVPIPPGGRLSDYVPFYFTPHSMMLYNIYTGYGSITRRANEDIVVLMSSVHWLRRMGLTFLYTNQHAYSVETDFYDGLGDLAQFAQIDWDLLQRRDFKTSDTDPGKGLRYQAEALVHQQVPLKALLGVGCSNDTVRQSVEELIRARGLELKVRAAPEWYF